MYYYICCVCETHFGVKRKARGKNIFCGIKCRNFNNRKKIKTNCGICQKEISVKPSERKNSRSKLNFCSRSCSVTYHNTHKKYGGRVSKLEKLIQEYLVNRYQHLNFDFNKKNIIGSELDIFIPDLLIGIELNGIFHYKPIYGQEKLDQVKNNDAKKVQACLNLNIKLFVIDTSDIKNITNEELNRTKDIIDSIIESREE